MNTKSRPTKPQAHQRYAPGSSRGPRSVTTLLAQVEDIERGQRIKARREELHLTQPAVVELIEDAAAELPADHALHPANTDKPPVSLRGYQTWEGGGGIAWEKAKLLAQVLRTDAQAMMNGEMEQTPLREAPSPFDAQDALADRLAAIEERLDSLHGQRDELLKLLERQDAVLGRIEDAIQRDDATRRLLDEASREALRRLEELASGAQQPAAGPKTSAT